MPAGRSFAEYVKTKCYDGLYEAAAKYASENEETLDLRTRRISRIGSVEFVDATIQRVYVRELPGMRVAFEVGIELELCVRDGNYRSDLEDECHPWIRVFCEGDISIGLDDWQITRIEPYNPQGAPLNSLSDALVPYIPYERLEAVATQFLKDYYPEALKVTPHGQPPVLVEPDKLAAELGLTIHTKRIKKDASVFGQLYFEDAEVLLYDANEDAEVPTPVEAKTILVDPRNYLLRNLGSVNNTIITSVYIGLSTEKYLNSKDCTMKMLLALVVRS